MRALQITGPGKTDIVEIKLPALKPDEILIKVMACGICGTDVHILQGDYLSDYPIVPGHEFSGLVEQTGEQVSRFKIGERVSVEPNISCDNCYPCLNNRQNFCERWQAIGVTLQGGMAEYVIAPEKVVFPTGELPFEYAAFMEPLSCILHGMEKIKINISDRVIILGAGPIGLLFLQAVLLQGAVRVCMLERRESRINLAEQYGAARIVREITDREYDRYDVVIDATGNISVMERCLDLTSAGGRILLFGVPAARDEMRLQSMKFFKKGLTMMSSFTSLRNSFQAVSLLQNRKIDVSSLLSHQLPLKDFDKGVEMIVNGKDNVGKVMILPNE